MQPLLTVAALLAIGGTLVLADVPPQMPNLASKKERQKSEKLPPCKSCSLLVKSFQEGMEKTARGKHDGGDAAWEEEKLGSYRTSEIRLVEIQERLCNDIGRGEDQCHGLAEQFEHDIEEWWFKHQSTQPDLHGWLCIERAQMCCPDGRYGPQCQPCADCSGNGRCKGNGTRKGNGRCACDTGYAGEACNQCEVGYYEAFRDAAKLLCTACHPACKADVGCGGAGPKNCKVCNPGWIMDKGCLDVDECSADPNACKVTQFCVNNEGSYSCLECDKSCDGGCHGDGPDMCERCASGYEMRDGMCTDVSSEKRDRYINYTRYLTYFGLCLATCIVFQSSTSLAALIGLSVAIYITVSEYWLKTTPAPAPNTPQPMTFEVNN